MAEVVRLHNGSCFHVAVLATPGRVWTKYITIEGYPLRCRRIRNTKLEAATRPLQLRGRPYPLKRAARQMIRVGKAMGMTKGAHQLLKEALK